MSAKDSDIPVAYVRECLSYDPETGVLRRLQRPREHFTTDRAWNTWNARYAGKAAGTAYGGGYLAVGLKFGHKRNVQAHRVAHALMTGGWPECEIDHHDGNPSNNRWDNLRPATRGEQCQNTSRNTGAFWDKARGKWQAAIGLNYRSRYLGRFGTPEEAHAAYLEAKARLHPFQPTPRRHRENGIAY